MLTNGGDVRAHWVDDVHFRSMIIESDIENTILYIGGAFQSLEDLYLVKRHLASLGNLILLELPGFGKSQRIPDTVGFDFYVKCIERALDSYEAQDVIGYGYSYGVGPLLKAASKLNHRFSSVVFASASASFTETMITQMRHLISVAQNDPASFPEAFERVLCYPDKTTLKNGRGSSLLLRRMLRSQTTDSLDRFCENYERLLREHQAVDIAPLPALLMIGEYDSYVEPSRLSEFGRFCHGYSIEIIRNCDHFFHLQDPEIDKELISQFLESQLEERYDTA